MRQILFLLMLIALPAGASGVDGNREKQAPAPVTVGVAKARVQAPQAPAVDKTVKTDLVDPQTTSSAPLYYLNWYSINGGGAVGAASASYRMGTSVGQAAAGFVSGTQFKMGVGFWYGSAAGACPVTTTGDVNDNGTITSADIIYLVNYVFKGGAAPLPCAASGDVNCSGTITSADIIYLVNYVFKGGTPPCDVCTLVPATWSCP
jgi:hypothetical protein